MAVNFEALPPQAAIDWWKKRGLILEPTFNWQDLWEACEHNAFAIAGITEMDLLDDLHHEIGRALKSGLPFSDFQKHAEKIIRLHGMWGDTVTTDPITGAERNVNLTTAGRLQNIFETNINLAIQEGRYNQISDTAGVRLARGEGMTYLRFNVSGGRVCPTCENFDGLTRPYNAAVWNYASPLLHSRCKCFLTSHTERDLKDFDYDISDEPELDIRTYHNERTGHTVQALNGVQPGFGTHDWGGKVRASFESYLKKQSAQNQKAIIERLGGGQYWVRRGSPLQ